MIRARFGISGVLTAESGVVQRMPLPGAVATARAIDAALALRRLERLHDIATAGAAHPLPIHPDVLAKWKPDPSARASSVASALRSDKAIRRLTSPAPSAW